MRTIVKTASQARIRDIFGSLHVYLKSRPVLTRWILAGPITIIASLLVMAGMVFWVPEGEAKVNNIALPIIVLPIIWAMCFFYICLAKNLLRASIILVLVILVHSVVVASAFM